MNLRNLILASSAALAVAIAAVPASATVVNFDDLVGSGVLANGYGGIVWNSQWTHYDAVQAPYTPASGTQRIYNFDALGVRNGVSSFNFLAPVKFDGASFSGFPTNSVYFELLFGGSLVHTSTLLTPTAVPTFLASGYSGSVDHVRVIQTTGPFYTMDNVTFQSLGAAVPEPATWAMMITGFGLAGVALRRRRSFVAA